MTRTDDFMGQLETYLDEHEGSTPLPEDVRDAIRAELPLIQQRPAWWPRRRFLEMNNMAKLGLAAAAVAVAAFLGFNYLAAPNVGGPGPDDPSSTPEPSPTPAARLNGQEPLDPGRYIAGSAAAFDVTVEVPSGWSASGDWVVIGPRDNAAPDGMAIRFYRVNNLAANPLSHSDGPIDPPLGPTVEDLVQALASHPDWETTPPTDITIDGYAGQLVELTIPADVEIPNDAGNDRYYLSVEDGGGIWGFAPGQTFDWYIVDVDGVRYIIDAFHYPGTSEEDLAAQRAVVESVQFDPKP
jgi:hypothetical protein